MAFDAGAIRGRSELDTQGWDSGVAGMLKSVVSFAAIAKGVQMVSDAVEASIKEANQYQKSFANVATIVDTSTVNMQALSSQVLNLNPALGKSTEIADALYQTFSSGASTAKEAMDITVQSAMFARAALTDTTTAVDAITTAINAYGKENMTAAKASDIFFQVVKDGKITGEQLASSIGRSIPLFSSVGVSLEQLGAGIATLTQVGVQGHEAMTQLNAIVNSFLKPSEEMAAALLNTGYASGAAFIKAEGLTGALKFLQDQTHGDASALSALLPNIDAVRGAMGLSGVSAQFYSKSLDDLTNSTGSTQKAFDTQEKTFDTLNNTLSNLSVVVGNIGKSFVDDLAKGATSAAQGVQQFVESNKTMEFIANTAGIVSAAFAGISAFAKPLIEVVGPGLKTIWNTLGKAFEEVTKKAGDSNVVMTGLGVVAQLGASAFQLMATAVNSAVRQVGDFVLVVIDAADAMQSLLIEGAMAGRWDITAKKFDALGKSIAQFATDGVKNVTDMAGTAWTAVSTLQDKAEETSKNIAQTVSTAFKDAQQSVLSNYQTMITGVKATDTSVKSEIYENTLNFLKLGMQAEKDYYDQQNKLAEETASNKIAVVESSQSIINGYINDALTLQQMANAKAARNYAETWQAAYKKQYDEFSKYATMLIGAVSYVNSTINTISNEQLQYEKSLLDQKQKAQMDELEQEHQNALIAAGVAEQTAVERAQAQLAADQAKLATETDAAKIAQDQQLVNEDLAALKKAQIDQEYADKKKALEDQQHKEQNDQAKKAFEANKINQAANATISAANAVMGFWAAAPQLGPVFGPIFGWGMSALVGGLLLDELVNINSQQFIPAYASGGTKQGDGFARVNELGGEIQFLKDGTEIIPADVSMKMAEGRGQAIYISFEGAHFTDKNQADMVVKLVMQQLGIQLKRIKK